MTQTPRGLLWVLVGLLATPTLAHADDTHDVLRLRDGSVLTGVAAEIVPQRLVRMTLGEAGTREVAWADIADASGPSFQALFGHPEEHAGPGRVAVDLSSVGAPMRLGRRDAPWVPTRAAPRGPFRALCMTPCRLYLEPGFQPIEADGVGIDPQTVELSVPTSGARVDLYAPPRGWSMARMMLPIPAAALGLMSAIFIGSSLAPANDKLGMPLPRPDWTGLGAGLAVLTVAVTLAILTGVAFRRARHGIATIQSY